MTEQIVLNLKGTNPEIINTLFRHDKHIGHKLLEVSNTLTSFKQFFDDNYNCIKKTITSTNDDITIELLLNVETSEFVRVTYSPENNHIVYLRSIEKSVVESIAGNFNELFPELIEK